MNSAWRIKFQNPRARYKVKYLGVLRVMGEMLKVRPDRRIQFLWAIVEGVKNTHSRRKIASYEDK